MVSRKAKRELFAAKRAAEQKRYSMKVAKALTRASEKKKAKKASKKKKSEPDAEELRQMEHFKRIADIVAKAQAYAKAEKKKKKKLVNLDDIKLNEEDELRAKRRELEIESIAKASYGLKVTKVGTIKMPKLDSKEITYELEEMPVTESTLKTVTKGLFRLAKKEVDKIMIDYPAGANINMKVHLEEDGVHASKTVKVSKVDDEKLYDAIYQKMNELSNAHYATKDYILSLKDVKIMVNGFGRRGGCHDGKTLHKRVHIGKASCLHLHDHKSKNNNCLIQCFNVAYGVPGNKLKSSTVRKDLGLQEGMMIDMKFIPAMSKYYNDKFKKNMGYILINQEYEPILYNNPSGKTKEEFMVDDRDDNANMVRLMLKGEHYLSFDMLLYRKCESCGDKLMVKNSTHECKLNRVSYHNNMISKKKNMVRTCDIETDKVDYDNLVYWDLETFQPADGGIRHEVYASGYSVGGEYFVHYGKGSEKKTFEDFKKMENKIITAYNGSSFDFYFLLDGLFSMGAIFEPSDMILNNGKLMALSFHFGNPKKKNKVFDLYLFTMCSLSKACEDFKIENCKTSLDHEKFKSWDDVDLYKKEVKEYLKMDVLALKELFEKFNDEIYELKKANITDYITCSNMGYDFWRSTLAKKDEKGEKTKTPAKIIEIPKDMEKMRFISKSIFGGRCYPSQREYISSMYDDVKSGKADYKDVMKSKDFIYNADASSLYPASMSGFDHMKVYYPLGESRWSDDPAKEFKDEKMGFYEIKYTPPTDIRVPILPRRRVEKGANVGIDWSLLPGEGVFTSVDIMNAIDAGYDVEFIGKALVYDKKGDIFSSFIKEFYKVKEEADLAKNDCMRSIAKLILNSLYGKMLMAPIDQTTIIINNIVELNDFCFKYNIVDWKILSENRLMLTGEVKDRLKEIQITKPRQLGSFVTAWSRRIMLFYMKKIDPTLKSQIFTYTDTDSLHIRGKDYLKLKKQGLVLRKEDAKLGYLCNDIKVEGIIIREMNLAPKTYMYEYINEKDEVKDTLKGKGIPKKYLKKEFYTEELPEKDRVVVMKGLKKKSTRLTKADQEKGVSAFSVVNSEQSRTFAKTVWEKMALIDNEFYPNGYQMPEDMTIVEI